MILPSYLPPSAGTRVVASGSMSSAIVSRNASQNFASMRLSPPSAALVTPFGQWTLMSQPGSLSSLSLAVSCLPVSGCFPRTRLANWTCSGAALSPGAARTCRPTRSGDPRRRHSIPRPTSCSRTRRAFHSQWG